MRERRGTDRRTSSIEKKVKRITEKLLKNTGFYAGAKWNASGERMKKKKRNHQKADRTNAV